MNLSSEGLLIADPLMPDVFFRKTVIWKCLVEDPEVTGYIVNRKLNCVIGDLFPALVNGNIPVFEGGPVENDRLFMIHRLPTIEGALALGNSLFFGGSFDQIQWLINHQQLHADQIRFYKGYCGWTVKQLSEEINHCHWHQAPLVQAESIFNESFCSWKRCIETKRKSLGVFSKFTEVPGLN